MAFIVVFLLSVTWPVCSFHHPLGSLLACPYFSLPSSLPTMSSPTPADMSLPAAVVPGLYIGDKRLAANKDVLHALGITHIVNVTHDVRHYFEHEPHSFTYLRCPW